MPSDRFETGQASTSVAVSVCTHQRNRSLARLLDSLEMAAGRAAPDIALGVIVVDDNADGRARAVVERSMNRFPGGLHYRWVGSGNIARARNVGLRAAMELADWVAMVDDDQVVVPDWLTELVTTQRRTGADAVAAPVYPKFSDEAPACLREQPFARLWGTPAKADGARVSDLQTANSMISTAWLEAHPDVRFSPELGRVGGEDMVFFRMALDAGLRGHYSERAVCWEYYEGERATYRYQLRRSLWHGNSEAVTNLRSGRASRARLVVRSVKRMGLALVGPVRRLRVGERPHLRFALACAMQPIGMLLGAAGLQLRHR